MLARVALNSILCAAIYLAPVAMHPGRLLHPAPWLAAAVALAVLLFQPPVDFREAVSRGAADRASALGIFGAMIAAQLSAAIDFAHVSASRSGWTLSVGVGLAIGGLALRLWAIRTLGRFFTSTVRVAEGQNLVRSGPYRLLRHPSYSGALIAAFGAAVALHSPIGAALVIALCGPAYAYRIVTEEHALVAALGETYCEYRDQTWALVPGVL